MAKNKIPDKILETNKKAVEECKIIEQFQDLCTNDPVAREAYREAYLKGLGREFVIKAVAIALSQYYKFD